MTPPTTNFAAWDPSQYARFHDHRLRPALDLLARIDQPGAGTVVDLGCGTGAVTARLAERWPEAMVTGVDSSAAMLASSQPAARLRWVNGDIATWQPAEPVDVVYSNAALHWLPDHPRLLPRLVSLVRPGGSLAVQMPQSFDLPSHTAMRAVLAGDHGGPALGTAALRAAAATSHVLRPEAYHAILAPRCARLEIWSTEYLHRLEGPDPVLEWVSGTGLRPILAGLDDGERAVFLAAYRDRLRVLYPRLPTGETLYPFRRLFIVATVPVATGR